jgi:hypothetical protein
MSKENEAGRLPTIGALIGCYESLVPYSPFTGESRQDFLLQKGEKEN